MPTQLAPATYLGRDSIPSLLFFHTDWWSRPEFVCYNLNIGSVIAAPAHDEVITLPRDLASGDGSSGGGGGSGGEEGDGSAQEGSGGGEESVDSAKAPAEGVESGGQEKEEPSYTLRGFAHTGGPRCTTAGS